jgi:plastocyanin
MRNARARGLVALAAGLVMTAAGCGGSSYGSNPTPMVTPTPGAPAADVVITIGGIAGDMSFSPNPANVKVGQTVAWKNSGGTTHTATQDGGAFDTSSIANGATSGPITMNAVGTLGYHCTFHPSMVGTINVTN